MTAPQNPIAATATIMPPLRRGASGRLDKPAAKGASGEDRRSRSRTITAAGRGTPDIASYVSRVA